MSSDKGYVAVYRDIFDHWLWKRKPFSDGQAWIDLILSANHADGKIVVDGTIVNIKRGEFFTSERKLAERWGWSRGKVSRFMRLLEAEHMASRKRSSDGTTITIENYSVYQGLRSTKRSTDGPLTGRYRATGEHKQEERTKKPRNKKPLGASAGGQSAALRPEDEHGDPLPDDYWEDA